jgi:hypothetical protein
LLISTLPILSACLPCLPNSITNTTIDGASAPNTQPRVAATINIPDPLPWTVLEGDATTQDYGWRQPKYHALDTGRGFDKGFHMILLSRGLTFGYYFSSAVLLLSELGRLADSRQTKFEGKPRKDRSNLHHFRMNSDAGTAEVNGSEGLWLMYDYSQNVLQMLYRDSLLKVNECLNPNTRRLENHISNKEMHRLFDLLTRGCNQAVAHEKRRLDEPRSGPAFALGFE